MRVQERAANGQVTTLGRFSGLRKAGGFSQKTFSLTPFKGQTVQIE